MTSPDEKDVKDLGTEEQPQYVLDHQAAFGPIESNIRQEITDHRVNDPNLDPELLRAADAALAKSDEKAELALEDVIEDDSIYPEVRAAVSNVDDPTMKANTMRAWLMGMIACTVLTGINMYFSAQWPQISFPAVAVQLMAYPIGQAMSRIPYPKHWPLAEWINPGPFNIKEHTMITIMSTVGVGAAYATDIFITQHAYYGQHITAGYMFLLIFSTQFIGFSYAGFCRQVLVWPAAMIWPSNLTSTAFLQSMHERHTHGSFRGWSRFKMFAVTSGILFVYEVIPSYLFTGLSYFSWPTWIAPNNKGVNVVFGGGGGIGLNVISLDWMQITSGLGSPIYTPWFAIANTMAGYIIIIAFVCPILWAKNVKYTGYLTFSSSGLYDRFGNDYSVMHVVNDDMTLNVDAYNSYSKEYLSATFLLSYALGFAAITSTLTHVALYYGKDIWLQFKRSLKEEPDIHARLMARYPEVPNWWYLITFLISFAMGIAAIVHYKTELPVWMLVIAILMSALYTIPIGIITAVTANEPGLNVIAEMIAGYALPGRPVAMMCFKTFGYISMYQAVSFVSDMKLGHYMKVPPRDMFWAQMISSLWACVVQVGVCAFMFKSTHNLCGVNPNEPVRPAHFTCQYQHTFYSASIIWGLIGPARSFAAGENYGILNILFIIGAVIPIPTWYIAKRFPESWVRLINWPVFFSSTGMMPPAGGINFTSWFLVGWIFQYWLRRHHFAIWQDYNYIISAGFDCGSALISFLISVCLELPNTRKLAVDNVFNGENLWWGNRVEDNTLQGMQTLINVPPPENGFAPAPNGLWLPNPIPSSSSS